MLRRLPLYILREHAGPFFLAFSVINCLFLLNVLIRDLGKFLSKGIPTAVILEFLFLNLAWMIALSVPMAVLCATLMAFGRLSADNEMTAIKASGISLGQILPSLLCTAALITAGLIWFNNNVLPDFNHRTRLLALDISRKKPTINLESGVLYTEIPNYAILVTAVSERDSISYLSDVVIDDQNEPNVIKTIAAKRGEMKMDDSTGMLQIALYEGEMQEVDLNEPESLKKLLFRKHILKISMKETILKRSDSGYRGDREKSAEQLMETVRTNQRRIAERERTIAELVQQQVQKYTQDKDFTWTLESAIQDHKQLQRRIEAEINMMDSYMKSRDSYLVEVHKKYSIPFACIVFILVGAPLGIMTRRSGWVIAAALSFGFFLLYWAFLIGGEVLADRRIISPFIAMWSPNIVVGIGGIYLLLRTLKERPLSVAFVDKLIRYASAFARRV